MPIIPRGVNDSRAYGGEIPRQMHLLYGGSWGKEIRDLREDVDRGFRNLEARTEFPNLHWVDVSASALNSAGGLLAVKGADMLQGQLCESYAHGAGDALVTFSALKPGKFDHSVVITDTGAVTVAYNGTTKVLTLTIDAGVTSATVLATAINAAGSAAHGIIRAVAGGTGAGLPAVLAATNFVTGKPKAGYGAGFTATVSGVEALPYHETGSTPTAPITDTLIRLTVPDLTVEADGRAVDDPMVLTIKVDGSNSQELPLSIQSTKAVADGPKLNGVDGSLSSFGGAGGDISFDGENLLQGQTFDTLTHGAAASQLDFDAMKPGNSGLTIELVDGGGADVVTNVGGAISVDFDGITHGNTSTADTIATAINAAGSAAKGIMRATSGGGGAVLALAATDLAGGAGSGFAVYVGGQECLPVHAAGTTPAATVTNTAVSVTSPAPGAHSVNRAAADGMAVVVQSDGIRSNPLGVMERDLRPNVPKLNGIDVSASTFDGVGGDIALDGENLLQGQTFDTLTHGAAASQLDFDAMKPGRSGIYIELVDDGGADVVSIVGSAISVSYDGPGSGNTSTADTIATAINAAGSAAKGIMRATSGGGGAVAALASTPLAGGLGAGFTFTLGGEECLPSHAAGAIPAPGATITNTTLILTVPAPTAHATVRAAGDGLVARVQSDGVDSNPLALRERDIRPNEPEVHWLDQTGGAPTNTGGDVTLIGANLLQGQTFDVYITGAGVSMIEFHALKPGNSGLTIELVDGGGADVVTIVGTAVSVDYDGPGNGDTSTAATIATAINANGAVTDGIMRANTAGGGGGSVAAIGVTPLVGGVGSGWFAYSGGDEALPQNEAGATSTAKITDTQMDLTLVDMNASQGMVATDIIVIWVVVDGVMSRVNLSTVLA